nr:zinc finger, CCHC-type [Tanacetum cinerariifolium]
MVNTLEAQIANLTSIGAQLTQSIQAWEKKLDDDESLGKGIRRNGGNNDGKKDAVKVFDELSSIKIGTVREHYDAFVPFARQMYLSGLGAISMFLWRLQPVIRRKVSSLKPKTLHDAYYLASMYESDYKHFWVSCKKNVDSNSVVLDVNDCLRNEGIKSVNTMETNDVNKDIWKEEGNSSISVVNTSEFSVVNKASKREQKRDIGNGISIRLMDCGFTKNGNLVLEPVCEKNEVEQDIGKEKDSNADINIVNGSGGEIIDGKSEDLESINEKSGGFELLEKRSLEFVKLAKVDCDADKTFNSDLEGKFSVGLELGNQYGGASLVATGTTSEDDMVKIQEKKEDSEVMNVKEKSGLTTLVFSNDGVGNDNLVVCDTLFERKKTRPWWRDKHKRNTTCPWWLNKHSGGDIEGDEVITTELRGCGDIWEEGEKGKEKEMVKGNKIVVGSLDVSPLKQPSDAQHLVGEIEIVHVGRFGTFDLCVMFMLLGDFRSGSFRKSTFRDDVFGGLFFVSPFSVDSSFAGFGTLESLDTGLKPVGVNFCGSGSLGEFGLLDKILVRKLLNSALKKFLPIVATIEQYQDLDEMSFEEAIGKLTAYEERIKRQDKLLMASSNNKTYGKWRGKDFNKEGKDSMKWKNNPNARRASTSQGTKDKSKLRCYKCGEHGHFAKECTKWKYKKDKQKESHLIYDTDTEPTLL